MQKNQKVKELKRKKNEPINANPTSNIEKVNKYMKNISSVSENLNKKSQLIELNEKSIKTIFGEESQKLSFEQKVHLLDRKINNYEIKEKIKLNLKLKNPNQECEYEYNIYDDDGNLIGKSENKKKGNDEIVLNNNLEMNYKFTKTKGITVVLIKHINETESIKTEKVIPLTKLLNNTNYEEKLNNFTDNESINVGFDVPEEKKMINVLKYILIQMNVKIRRMKILI